MYFNPTIPLTLAPLSRDERESYAEMWSDMHKDAYGFRPRVPFSQDLMGAAIEVDGLSQWVAEEERIRPMREAVARYDFSKAVAMRIKRDGMTSLEAFKHAVQCAKVQPYPNDELPSWEEVMEDVAHYGWSFIAMDLGLPQGDGKLLQAEYERLLAAEAS